MTSIWINCSFNGTKSTIRTNRVKMQSKNIQ